ncbi:MAG TPA: hypothetical protein VM253_08855 [Candidatus Limnocylindrales bacterium]|jgi:hypothetical protein|nr:hypothetical protein [Candidatus Limnocylindrales bacterium]
MNVLTDPFTPATFPDLFTLMWVAGLGISIGAIIVYNLAQRRYRRYPELLALHEWIFWPIIVTWGIIPLLVVIGVPLFLQLVIVLTGMGIAAYAAFVKFPPRIAAANDEIRRRRFVPPPRREERGRAKPTPAGRRRKHR